MTAIAESPAAKKPPSRMRAFRDSWNGLSRPHRTYLAAGGLGLLIGDGRLNYSPETAFESYYSLNLGGALALTFDYQHVVNPGYNADRGPVNVFGTRLHAEF